MINLICKILLSIYLMYYISCCRFTDAPSFEDYVIPVGQIYISMNIQPERIFKDSSVREITERFVSGIEYLEPNFAGKYLIFEIPCGNMCERIGVINCETGEVTLPLLPTAEHGILFVQNSALLIINPKVNIFSRYGRKNIPDWIKTEYYEFKDGTFVLLRSEEY